MGSNESTSAKQIDQEKTGNRRQRVELQRVQNVLLIWLDSSAADNTDDCRNTVRQLRRAVNDINTYTNSEQCIQFIKTIKNNKVFLVISGSLGQDTVPRAHDMSQVDAIFIFCSETEHHERWTKNWPKIRGVFTEINPLCEALRQAAQQCEQNVIPMSFVASNATGDRLDPSFMYTQLLKEILLTMDFSDQDIQGYVDYCREAFQENPEELEYVKQLEQRYRENTPIWWYTCECFLYPMLNKALRTMDGDILIRLGFFVKDLHRNIEREHQKQYVGCGTAAIFTVYRGQGLSEVDFEQLKRTNGGLLSFNCFLSTSKQRHVSLGFAENEVGKPASVGILFEIKIDPSQSTTPFASIRDLSAIGSEDEVLFGMHSVFRVREINVLGSNSRLYEVHLSLTGDDDSQLRVLTDRIREESFPDNEGWYRLALVLRRMNQLEKSEEIYKALLDRETNDSTKAAIYHQLGLVKHNRGEYELAIGFYKKVLAIRQQSLPPTSPILAPSYNNIGNIYQSMGDYPKALAAHEKALKIYQQSLPSTHPDLAMSYDNIGLVYDSMGNYPRALVSYEKALTIYQQSLPSTHPNLAMTHNNVGSAYYNMGNYPKALVSYEKALAIRQQSLPPTHPDLAASHVGIANVHHSMGDYSKALVSHEKALAIRQQSLPSTHPDLATTFHNVALTYEQMGNYSKAYSCSERAVQIGEKSLPTEHPHLKLMRKSLANIKKKL